MLRSLVPIKNSVVCRKLNPPDNIVTDGLISYKKKDVDLYRIIDVSTDDPEFRFQPGDIVMSCSTGDEIEINPHEIVYLFRTENIMCKVEDESNN